MRRFDKASVIGVGLGLVAIIGGRALEGGSPVMLFQPTAALIVFCGTLGAALLSFPSEVAWRALRAGLSLLARHDREGEKQVIFLAAAARQARRDSVLKLDEAAEVIGDPFLRKAMRLVVDGTTPAALRETMRVELESQGEFAEQPIHFLEAAAGYAPTVGIIGAVLGLIRVMEHLADTTRLGAGIAVAFIATIYGVALANLFLLPAATRLRLRHEQDWRIKEMIIEGAAGIAEGLTPSLLDEKLRSYLVGDRDSTAEARDGRRARMRVAA